MAGIGEDDAEEAVAALASLSRAELASRWLEIFGVPPPKGAQRGLLERAAAYELQARAFGRLSPASRRALLGGRSEAQMQSPTTRPTLRPGTRLVREWHGVVHQVDAAEGGFVWKGKRYRSLSAIARAITGAAWSGPRFFGL